MPHQFSPVPNLSFTNSSSCCFWIHQTCLFEKGIPLEFPFLTRRTKLENWRKWESLKTDYSESIKVTITWRNPNQWHGGMKCRSQPWWVSSNSQQPAVAQRLNLGPEKLLELRVTPCHNPGDRKLFMSPDMYHMAIETTIKARCQVQKMTVP